MGKSAQKRSNISVSNSIFGADPIATLWLFFHREQTRTSWGNNEDGDGDIASNVWLRESRQSGLRQASAEWCMDGTRRRGEEGVTDLGHSVPL